MYYDFMGKLIQDFHQTNRNNIIRNDYQYRFNGELLKVRKVKKQGSTILSTKILSYDYDHTGRKIRFKYSLNGAERTIAKYSYDEIGRLKQKTFSPSEIIGSKQTGSWLNTQTWLTGNLPTISDQVTINQGHTVTIPVNNIGNAGSLFDKGTLRNEGVLNLGNTISGSNSLQKLDYKYHIRGGMKGINLDASGNLSNSIFSYKLDYEDDGTYYDGNVRKQSWKSNLDNVTRSYTYSYDGSSRILQGLYTSTKANENYNLNSVGYDANGNITSLSRNGLKTNNTFGLIDNLNYTYNTNSNKILKVDDASNETASFKDVTGNDYDYWSDGSLKKDNNKEISNITYNYLKLPEQITLSGGRWIKYQYDANGTKLKKTLSTGKATDYEEDEIYENGILYQTAHDEGRIVGGVFEYNINDHLGNLRVAFKDSLGIAKVVQYENHGVWGESLEGINFSRPTKNNFTYSTYEKEDDFGIGVFDAHARVYDAIAPRFWQIDPMAEKFHSLNPYNYVFNNPIIFIDPDGQVGDFYKEDGTYLGNDGKNDDKVFVVKNDGVKSSTTDENGYVTNTFKVNAVTDLGVSHTEFIALAAVINLESSGGKNESYAIGNVMMNFIADGGSTQLKTLADITLHDNNFVQGATQENYTNFTKLNPHSQNSKFELGAAINAIGYNRGLAGFSDYSKGANTWDGVDLVDSSFENQHRSYSWNTDSKDLLKKYQKDNNGGVNVSDFTYKKSGFDISATIIIGKTLFTNVQGGRGEKKQSNTKFK
jgi:RHS repeat-associated protein